MIRIFFFFLTEPIFNKLFSLYDTFDLIFHEIPSKDDKSLVLLLVLNSTVESFPGFLGFRIGRFLRFGKNSRFKEPTKEFMHIYFQILKQKIVSEVSDNVI